MKTLDLHFDKEPLEVALKEAASKGFFGYIEVVTNYQAEPIIYICYTKKEYIRQYAVIRDIIVTDNVILSVKLHMYVDSKYKTVKILSKIENLYKLHMN